VAPGSESKDVQYRQTMPFIGYPRVSEFDSEVIASGKVSEYSSPVQSKWHTFFREKPY
jgi:hypothetical protein